MLRAGKGLIMIRLRGVKIRLNLASRGMLYPCMGCVKGMLRRGASWQAGELASGRAESELASYEALNRNLT